MPCKGYCGNEDFAVPLHRRKDIKNKVVKLIKKVRVMKTMMNQMRMRCCCCSSMQMSNNDKEERTSKYIINIHKERKKYEEVNIYNSIALRAAS